MIMQEPTGSLVHSYTPFPPSFLLKEPQFCANIKKSDVFGIAMSFFNHKERIMIGRSQSWQPPIPLSRDWFELLHWLRIGDPLLTQDMWKQVSVMVAGWFQEKSFLLSKRNTWEKICHSSMFYLLILYLLLMSVSGAGKNACEPASRN